MICPTPARCSRLSLAPIALWPMTPMMVVSSPTDRCALKPRSSTRLTSCSTCSLVAPFCVTMITASALRDLAADAVEVGLDRRGATEVDVCHRRLRLIGVELDHHADAARDAARVVLRHVHLVTAKQRHIEPTQLPGCDGRELSPHVAGGGEPRA